jgi:hypothetical protein
MKCGRFEEVELFSSDGRGSVQCGRKVEFNAKISITELYLPC